MKKNEDELTELFRSRLKQYEIPLKQDMWEELEKELSKPSPRKLYSACFIAVAAIFLLLLACSAAVWMYTPQNEMSASLCKASVPAVKRNAAMAKAEKVIPAELPMSDNEEPKSILKQEEVIENTAEQNLTDSVIDKVQPEDKAERSVLTADVPKTDILAEDKEETKKVCIPSEWTVGLTASVEKGKTISSIGDNLQPITINHKSPISLGVIISKKVARNLSLESGLNYTLLRSESKDLSGTTIDKQKIHFLGIPLKANWAFFCHKKFNAYLSAGGMLEECISPKPNSGSSDSDDQPLSINGLQCSLASSLGLQYNVTDHVALFAEPGVAYYFDDHTLASTIRRERPLNFSLHCGVKVMY
jgi:hypothetical protein